VANKTGIQERHILVDKPSRAELEMALILGHARELVAVRGKYYKELGLDLDKGSEQKIIEVLEAEPRMLKRPLFFDGSRVLAGFNNAKYREFFAL